MSNTTLPMQENRFLLDGSTGLVPGAWRLMFVRELSDLWVGGKALYLILAYSIFLAFRSYLQVKISQTDFIPVREMVFSTLQTALYTSGLLCMIVGADSLSGDRERGLLETLLLTPASPRQLMLGKFLAGLSPWPIAFVIAIPFLKVLSQGDSAFDKSVVWGGILGSLLAIGFTSLGMLVSTWTNSNRVSLFVSLGLYLFIMLPTSWPATSMQGLIGKMIQRLNPLYGTNLFLEKVLVSNRSLTQYDGWLRSPEIFAAVAAGLLLFYAASRLHAEADAHQPFPWRI